MSRPAAPASRRKQGENATYPERQLVGVQDLAGVQAGERDLGRARQVEAVLGNLVDVRFVAGEGARADQRLFAHEHGGQDGHEALLGEAVEREAVERQRKQRGIADPIAEPGA